MGLSLRDIRKRLNAVGAQINPFDEGATYNTVRQNRPPVRPTAVQRNTAANRSFLDKALHYGPSSAYETFTNPTNYRDATVGLGRSFARIPETASRSWVELTGGQPQSAGPATDPVRRFLYGSEPLETYQKRGAGIEKETGIPKSLAAVGLAALDLTPGGKGKIPKVSTIKAGVNATPLPRPSVSLKTPPTSVKASIKQAGQGSKATLKTNIDPTDPFGNRGIVTRIRSEAGKLIETDADMIRMLRSAEKQTGKKGLVDQWYFDTGNIRASNAMANARLMQDPDLAAGLKGLSKKELKGFDEYAGARAELRNYEGKKTFRAPEETQRIVSAGEAKYGQRFGAVNDYYKGLAKEMHDAGLIDTPTYRKYVSSDDYIRIQRDMDDLVNPQFSHSESRSFGSTTATQKRTGSRRAILSPTESVAKRTQQVQLEINRNRAATNITGTLENLGLAKRVSESKGKNTVSRFVDGKKETFEVPKEIKEVIDNVNPYHLGIIARVVSSPVRLLRAGTTALSAPFAITNYVRDQIGSAIFSRNARATHNPINAAASFGSASRDFVTRSNHPLWEKFERYYGNQTIFDELRNAKSTRRQLREIRKPGAGRAFNMATNPIRTLEDLIAITEKSTRFQNFKGIYQKAIKAGKSEDIAIREAVIAARQNSVDFSRHGNFTRTMNLLVPYFNASAQGSRNLARAFRDRPVGTTAKTVGLVALPTLALTAWNYSDNKRREVYESIDEFEKEGNYIIVGPNPKQREDGAWEGVWKIPKPQGYRDLVDPARELAEGFFKGESSINVASIANDLVTSLSGPIQTDTLSQAVGGVIPQQGKPFVQAALNKDLFTGKPIVPDYMQDATDAQGQPVDPSKMAYENTSGFARMVASQLGVSPIKVEKAISDISGSVGRYGLNAVDNVLASTGKIPVSQIGGRSITQDIKRRLAEASGELLERNKTAGSKYYDKQKAFTATLNQQEKDLFNKINPTKKNFLGDKIFESNKLTKVSDYADMIANPDFTAKYQKFQKSSPKHDPLWDLDSGDLRSYMQAQVISKNDPGGDSTTVRKLYERLPEDFFSKREKFFADLKAEAVAKGKPWDDKDYKPRPKMPDSMATWSDWYHTLPYGTGARSAALRSPEGQKYIAWLEQNKMYNNQERADLGLPPLEDESSRFGSGGGGGGSAPTGRIRLSKGRISAPKISVKKSPVRSKKVAKVSKPKVSIKKSLV
jgi:hypothetical protein